jgi:hypothetical protein
MKPNEKTAISAKDSSFNKNLTGELLMNKYKPTNEKTQAKINFGNQPKALETIHCFECNTRAELDGYRFRLVPLCRDCRTERSLEILSNQIARRTK